MSLRRQIFIFISFIIFMLLGCREYNYYSYVPAVLEILQGSLTINFIGVYGKNYEKDGKKYADYGGPYSLQFMFSLPSEISLFKLEVKDIELIGVKSFRHFSLPGIVSKEINNTQSRYYPNEGNSTLITSVEIPHNGFEYEAYILTATVFVYENSDIYKKETIKVEMKTDLFKKHRSDWFDKKMSP